MYQGEVGMNVSLQVQMYAVYRKMLALERLDFLISKPVWSL
jgi:hypothetical protein